MGYIRAKRHICSCSYKYTAAVAISRDVTIIHPFHLPLGRADAQRYLREKSFDPHHSNFELHIGMLGAFVPNDIFVAVPKHIQLLWERPKRGNSPMRSFNHSTYHYADSCSWVRMVQVSQTFDFQLMLNW